MNKQLDLEDWLRENPNKDIMIHETPKLIDVEKLLEECREMAFKIREALAYGKINNVFDLTYQLENKIDKVIGEK